MRMTEVSEWYVMHTIHPPSLLPPTYRMPLSLSPSKKKPFVLSHGSVIVN